MADKKSFWNEAGLAGLCLGAVPIVYFGTGMLIGLISPEKTGLVLIGSAVSLLLWVAKLLLCIYLMRSFMQRFSSSNPEADNSHVFRFGCAVAFLSALIYSAFYLAYVGFIAPDTFSTAMEAITSNPMMDSNSLSAVEEMMPKMPRIAFFANLIYCTLYGTVLSAILSRNIPPENPFLNKNGNE